MAETEKEKHARQNAKMAKLQDERRAAFMAKQNALMAIMQADKAYAEAAQSWVGYPEEISTSISGKTGKKGA